MPLHLKRIVWSLTVLNVQATSISSGDINREETMSRYRNDRDDEYESGPSRGRGSSVYDDRYESSRGDYGRSGARDYDDYGRDRYGERGGYGTGSRTAGRGYEDYGRDRPGESYGYRDRYTDESRPSRRGDERDEDEGRSLYEEGRDYLRRRMGERRGGASRSHVRCRDIMTRDVTVATRATTLQEVAKMMKDEDTGVIPVVDNVDATSTAGTDTTLDEARKVNTRIHGNGKLVGLITDRDVVIRAIAEGKDAHTTRAEEIMTTDIHTAQPNDRVIEAIRKMGDKQVRRIPIVDRDGILRGIISMADVALETNDDRELAEALEEISSGSSFWNRIFG